MKFSTGVIIFFLALVALVAEFVLYLFFGISAAFSGVEGSVTVVAMFFVWLMIMTIAAGIGAPLCGFIENVANKPNVGMYTYLSLLGVTAIGAGGIIFATYAPTLKGDGQSLFSSGSTAGRTWRVHEEKSVMDGSKSVTLQLEAENEAKGWLSSKRPTLIIDCRDGKTRVYVHAGQGVQGYNRHTIRTRLDEQQYAKQTWQESTDGQSLLAPNSAVLADQIAQAKTMLFEFTPFNSSAATVKFNVAGLNQHIGKVKEACGRKGK